MDNQSIFNHLNDIGSNLEEAVLTNNWNIIVNLLYLHFDKVVEVPEPEASSAEDALLERVMKRLANQGNTPAIAPKAPKVSAKTKKKITPKPIPVEVEPLAPLDFHNTAMVIQNAQPIQAKGAGSVKVTNYKPTVISTKASLSEQAILKATAEKADTKITRPETKPCMMTCTLCQKPFDFLKAYPGGKFGDSDIVRCNTCQTKG